MIAELGHFALILALVVAALQATAPMAGAALRRPEWMAVAVPAALVQFALVAAAFAALTHAYVVSDFSVLNVVENSHTAKPLIYKISGVWGNHEGSMLLWALILTGFGAALAAFGRGLPATLKARALAVQAMIGVGFLAFLLFASNPFARVWPPPADGNDLNPLLQDPGLAFHPPFLYVGYVGFSMAFSFAVAALVEGRVDAAWARWVRPWTLAAWAALTVGIALGSWWAYYELGWGGWWFWDPVENASLMPWLAGTALLHSAIVVEKRDALKSWTVLLAILTFSLSLLGTFLVRSGVLTSVHAFAVDPARGVFVLALLGIAVGGSLTLYALRADKLSPGGAFAPISREGALVVNNLLLTTMAATVLVGTLYPLFLDALGGATVSVGAPFFNAAVLPLAAPLVLLTAIGPMLSWKRADAAGALARLGWAALLALAVAFATLALAERGPWLAALAVAGAAWLILGSLAEWADRVRLFRAPFAETRRRAANLPRSAWGMTLAHAGLGVAILGMTGTSLWMSESVAALRPGDRVAVAGYELRFERVEQARGPNYVAERGVFTAFEDGREIATLEPERRSYPAAGMGTTEAAIRTTPLGDLYVTIGEPRDGAWPVRATRHPLVPWIWIGAGIMALGGVVSLTDRRWRVGAPTRARRAAAPPTAAPNAAE